MKEKAREKTILTGVGLASGTTSAAATNMILNEGNKKVEETPEDTAVQGQQNIQPESDPNVLEPVPVSPEPIPVNPIPEPVDPAPGPVDPAPEPIVPEIQPDPVNPEPEPIDDMYMPNIEPDIIYPDIVDPVIINDDIIALEPTMYGGPIDDDPVIDLMYGGPIDDDMDDPIIDDEEDVLLADDDSLLMDEDVPL